MNAAGAAVVFADHLDPRTEQRHALRARVFEDGAAHIGKRRSDINGDTGVFVDRIGQDEPSQCFRHPQGQRAGRMDRRRGAGVGHGVERLGHAPLQVFEKHFAHVLVEHEWGFHLGVADQDRVSAQRLPAAADDLADAADVFDVEWIQSFDTPQFVGRLDEFGHHADRADRQGHILCGDGDAGVGDLIELSREFEGLARVLERCGPPLSVEGVDIDTVAAGIDGEILVNAERILAEADVGIAHGHLFGILAFGERAAHPVDALLDDVFGKAHLTSIAIHRATERIEVVQRFGVVDLHADFGQNAQRVAMDGLHLVGGQKANRVSGYAHSGTCL